MKSFVFFGHCLSAPPGNEVTHRDVGVFFDEHRLIDEVLVMVVQPDLDDQLTVNPVTQATFDCHTLAVDVKRLADENRPMIADVIDGINTDEPAAAAPGRPGEQRDESVATVMVSANGEAPPQCTTTAGS